MKIGDILICTDKNCDCGKKARIDAILEDENVIKVEWLAGEDEGSYRLTLSNTLKEIRDGNLGLCKSIEFNKQLSGIIDEV